MPNVIIGPQVRIKPIWQLGDAVEAALGKAGVTKNLVEKWLGRPCNCADRKAKLNQLSNWARRVLTGKHPEDDHKDLLERIVGEK